MNELHFTAQDDIALQNSFINRTFGMMSGGLLVSALTGYLVAQQIQTNAALAELWGCIFIFCLILELVLVSFLSARIEKLSPATAFFGFIFYSALNGVTLSTIFIGYQLDSVTPVFVGTAATFAACGIWGWATQRDLSGLGRFCTMALMAFVVFSLIMLFIPSTAVNALMTFIGLAIFVGLTTYDMQKLKKLSYAVSGGNMANDDVNRIAVLAALQLYLDFVNLFLLLLRIFGKRK